MQITANQAGPTANFFDRLLDELRDARTRRLATQLNKDIPAKQRRRELREIDSDITHLSERIPAYGYADPGR